jgi:hypothetical protein
MHPGTGRREARHAATHHCHTHRSRSQPNPGLLLPATLRQVSAQGDFRQGAPAVRFASIWRVRAGVGALEGPGSGACTLHISTMGLNPPKNMRFVSNSLLDIISCTRGSAITSLLMRFRSRREANVM